MPIILMIMIFTAMISVGVLLLGPMTKRGKTVDTQKTVDGAISTIISWSIANNRIPDATLPPSVTGFASVAGNPRDAYGNPLVYIYDSNLTSPATGGICGRQSTNLRVSTVTDNIAFVVISGGEDGIINSTPNTSQAYGGTVAVSPNDLVKWITLEELKNKAGCYGTTQGRLKILNNELPKACTGSSYTAKVYAEGGAPFTGTQYQWCTQGTLPTGITATPGTVCPTWSANASNVQLTGTAPSTPNTYPITFMVRDSDTSTAQKTLPINVVSCVPPAPPAPPGAQISFFNNIDAFASSKPASANTVRIDTIAKSVTLGGEGTTVGNGWGCLWYKDANSRLKNNIMRTYFEFKALSADTSANSTAYADGFTFSVIEAARTPSYVNGNLCGAYGPNLGYRGNNAVTQRVDSFNSVALEFDVRPNYSTPRINPYYGDWRDPVTNSNHIAAVINGNNVHAAGFCPGTGCYYPTAPANVTWMEDLPATPHKARIEIITGCGTPCVEAQCGGTGTYALLKAWVDPTVIAPADPLVVEDLTKNLTAAEAGPPQVQYCFNRNARMDNVYFGFTEGSSPTPQGFVISRFGTGFFSSVCAAISITTASLPNGITGQNYNQLLTGTGGLTPYTWSAHSLPPGLSINAATGRITGRPTTAGTYTTTVTMRDSCGSGAQTVSKTYTITISRTTYTVRNSTGNRYYVKGGSYAVCTRRNNGATFNVNTTDTTAVSVYIRTDANCIAAPVAAVTHATAQTVDLAGNKNGQVQINNTWILIDY